MFQTQKNRQLYKEGLFESVPIAHAQPEYMMFFPQSIHISAPLPVPKDLRKKGKIPPSFTQYDIMVAFSTN